MDFSELGLSKEIKELRTYYTKDFEHPEDPSRRVKVCAAVPLHAKVDGVFKDIKNELGLPSFPIKLDEGAEKFTVALPENISVIESADNITLLDEENFPFMVMGKFFVYQKDGELYLDEKIDLETDPEAIEVPFSISNNQLEIDLKSLISG